MDGCKSFEGHGLWQRSGLALKQQRSYRIARGDPQPRSAQLHQPRSFESRQRSPALEWTTSRRGRGFLEAALSRAQRLLVIPSSRQAHRSFHCTGEETRCSRVCKDRAGRESEAAFRGGVRTGGMGFGMFPTGGRDFRWVRTMPAGMVGSSHFLLKILVAVRCKVSTFWSSFCVPN